MPSEFWTRVVEFSRTAASANISGEEQAECAYLAMTDQYDMLFAAILSRAIGHARGYASSALALAESLVNGGGSPTERAVSLGVIRECRSVLRGEDDALDDKAMLGAMVKLRGLNSLHKNDAFLCSAFSTALRIRDKPTIKMCHDRVQKKIAPGDESGWYVYWARILVSICRGEHAKATSAGAEFFRICREEGPSAAWREFESLGACQLSHVLMATCDTLRVGPSVWWPNAVVGLVGDEPLEHCGT